MNLQIMWKKLNFIKGCKMSNLIWIRKKIVPESEAKVNVLSPTSQFGLNVFEGIRCYWNDENKTLYAFRLEDHLKRLMQSCKLLHISIPYSFEEMLVFFKKIIIANNFKEDCAVRMTIFGDGIGSWHSIENFDMFIAPIIKHRTNVNYLKGKTACISSWRRINDNILPPRAKIGANYINSRFGFLEAKKNGYDVPIFLDDLGKVSESSGACIFLVRDNKLITPNISSSILESITRDTIIKLANKKGIEVEERMVDRTELYIADEVFLCGTAAEITPIISIDGYRINDGKIGIFTLEFLKEYLDIVSGTDIIYDNWIYPIFKEEKC
jgi:branched-chain amino acid aminotransferase